MQEMTLARAQADVELLGDLQGLVEEGGRHEPAEVRRLLCQSERSLRTLLSGMGMGFSVESTTPAALPVSPVITGEDYCEVAWPADSEGLLADEIVAVHVNADSYGWRQIEPVDWAQRRAFASQSCSLYWCIRRLPRTDPANVEQALAGRIAILPVPRGGLYSIDFLPHFPELENDDDVFLGVPEWHRWRTLDTIVQLLGLRDGDSSGRAQWAAQERAASEQRIREAAPGRSKTPKAIPRRRPRGT